MVDGRYICEKVGGGGELDGLCKRRNKQLKDI